MKVNKILVLVAFVVVFLLGILLGFNLKNRQTAGEPIDLNPFPKSCRYNNETYKSGENFPAEDGCNTCGCENGKVVCTLMACE